MKTLLDFLESNLDFTDFVNNEPCEITEDLYDYFADILPPQFQDENLFQANEAEFEMYDLLYYMTFSKTNEKYFYIGICPEFGS